MLTVASDVVEREHPLLGWVWGPEPHADGRIRKRLTAHSELQLLERSAAGDRLEVAITTGRPHQIRIHLAQLGSPLLGDPLYGLNREISALATPGEGGYRLHAWRLEGTTCSFSVLLPPIGSLVENFHPQFWGRDHQCCDSLSHILSQLWQVLRSFSGAFQGI